MLTSILTRILAISGLTVSVFAASTVTTSQTQSKVPTHHAAQKAKQRNTRTTSTHLQSSNRAVRLAEVGVTRLPSHFRQVFSTTIPGSSGYNESFPIESDGVLFVTTPQADVIAMNALTGKVMWHYSPTLHIPQGIPEINRGVAVGAHRIYVLTPDDQLIALKRSNGHPVFDVKVSNADLGYFETMAPRLAEGRVIVGSAGGDEGVRGFVAAYSAKTGKQLWRFYTIPKRGSGWVPASGDHGGGAVWTTPTFGLVAAPAQSDVTQHSVHSSHSGPSNSGSSNTHPSKLPTLFVGTGNPSPDYFGKQRPGPDLYTDSVLSINIVTGKLQWYRQEVSHDLWDYDVASPALLFQVGGQTVVGEAGKDGFWYEWNAASGKPYKKPVAFVKENHQPPTASGTLEWPGPDGGANYGPSAYDHATQDAYVAGIDGPETLYAGPTQHSGYQLDFGTHQAPAPKADWTGTITAIHTASAKIAWQVKTPAPPIGGVTDDGDGTISYGLPNGQLVIRRASDGHLLWTTKVGAPIGMAPTVYRLRGGTYVAVVTGGSGSLTMFPWSGPDKVLVYRVD